MSHVSGPLTWSEGIYLSSHLEADRIVLTLKDGTSRYMNFKNWGETALVTADKVQALRRGAAIRIASWKDFDPAEWFCDVEEVKNPFPTITQSFPSAWIVKYGEGARGFDDKLVVRCVDCCIFEREVSQHFVDIKGYARRSGYRIEFFALDPFFHSYRATLYCCAEDFSLLDEQAEPLRKIDVNSDEVPGLVADKWEGLDLLDFAEWLEDHIDNARSGRYRKVSWKTHHED